MPKVSFIKWAFLADWNREMTEGKIILPIARNNPLLLQKQSGRDLVIEGNSEYARIIEGIKGLEALGFNTGMIMESSRPIGIVFAKDGKWNYLDIFAFGKETLLMLEPYLTIEGKISKEQFFKDLESYPSLGHSL